MATIAERWHHKGVSFERIPVEGRDGWLAERRMITIEDNLALMQLVDGCCTLVYKTTNSNVLAVVMQEGQQEPTLSWIMGAAVRSEDPGDGTLEVSGVCAGVEAPTEEDRRMGCRVVLQGSGENARGVRHLTFTIASDPDHPITLMELPEILPSGIDSGRRVWRAVVTHRTKHEGQEGGHLDREAYWLHYVYLNIPDGSVTPQSAFALLETMTGDLALASRNIKLTAVDMLQIATGR